MSNQSNFLIQAPNVLRDALHNCDPATGSDPAYTRGVVVGAMAGMMAATGASFDRLLPILFYGLPKRFDPDTIPVAWRDAIAIHHEEGFIEFGRVYN